MGQGLEDGLVGQEQDASNSGGDSPEEEHGRYDAQGVARATRHAAVLSSSLCHCITVSVSL